MVGIVGGKFLESLKSMENVMNHEPWYGRETLNIGPHELVLLHHGARDPDGYICVENDKAIGILHGVITNKNELDASFPELVNRVLEEPSILLPKLEGSYILSCANKDKLIVAVDKLGTKPCFHVTNGNVAFSSEVKALLEEVESPTTNPEAIGDLMTFNFMWGGKTLVEEIVAVPPGSYIKWSEGGKTTQRYFEYDFEKFPNEGYVDDLLSVYQNSVRSVSETFPEGAEIGAWLSGGLDSRLLAGAVSKEVTDFHTFTFDANPGGGANIQPARMTADVLGIENRVLDFTPEEFAEVLEEGVKLSDGRLPWRSYFGLPFILKVLPDQIDIFVEGTGQGELFGEDIRIEDLQSNESPTRILFDNFARQSEAEVNECLTTPVNLESSVRKTVETSTQSSTPEIILDTLYRVFYPYFHCRTRFYEAKVPLRMPLSNERLLQMAINQPDQYRRRVAPYPLNKISPVSEKPVSELKLELIRKFDQGLETIQYERTKISPQRHWIIHAFRYWMEMAWLKLSGRDWKMDRWYQENDRFRQEVDKWLEDAKERDIFDADAIEEKRKRHLDGEEKNLQSLTGITTAEIWLQNYVDSK